MNEISSNKFNMVIEPELKKQFNIKCIENGTTMSKVLKDFIKEYVKDSSVNLDTETEEIIYNSFME